MINKWSSLLDFNQEIKFQTFNLQTFLAKMKAPSLTGQKMIGVFLLRRSNPTKPTTSAAKAHSTFISSPRAIPPAKRGASWAWSPILALRTAHS